MSELQYWIALNLIPEIGPVVIRRLLSAFGSAENVFIAPLDDLRKIEGVGRLRAQKIISFNRWESVKKEIDTAGKKNIRIIHLNDPAYPAYLRQFLHAPIVLYCRGDLQPSDNLAVAIVGSRDCTDYGENVAYTISRRLAESGLTIVSGMALGIDAVSHKGAIDAGGRTIAVLGSGVDKPYPVSNRKLMYMIEANGAVISEFPLGSTPQRENFPRRNRIISALSLGVVVVEATLDSGSLITVRYALEQGKEVFAVPGNITSKNSKGTNNLIKNGARLVEDAEDILEELTPQLKGMIRELKRPLPEMSDEELTLYNYLGSEPKHIDIITRDTKIHTPRALSLLLNLELKGVVRQAKGKHFALV